MSDYKNLPIYNDVFKLLKYFYQKIPTFSKQYKYLLGKKILDSLVKSITLIIDIIEIKEKEDKKDLLNKIIKKMNKVLIYTRIAHELNQFQSDEVYFFASKEIIKIIDQAENWKMFFNKEKHPQNCSQK